MTSPITATTPAKEKLSRLPDDNEAVRKEVTHKLMNRLQLKQNVASHRQLTPGTESSLAYLGPCPTPLLANLHY